MATYLKQDEQTLKRKREIHIWEQKEMKPRVIEAWCANWPYTRWLRVCVNYRYTIRSRARRNRRTKQNSTNVTYRTRALVPHKKRVEQANECFIQDALALVFAQFLRLCALYISEQIDLFQSHLPASRHSQGVAHIKQTAKRIEITAESRISVCSAATWCQGYLKTLPESRALHKRNENICRLRIFRPNVMAAQNSSNFPPEIGKTWNRIRRKLRRFIRAPGIAEFDSESVNRTFPLRVACYLMRKYSLLHRRAHHTDIYLIFVPVWSLSSVYYVVILSTRANTGHCVHDSCVCAPITSAASRTPTSQLFTFPILFSRLVRASISRFYCRVSRSTVCASCHLRHSQPITPNRISRYKQPWARQCMGDSSARSKTNTVTLPHARYAHSCGYFRVLFLFRFRRWCWSMCKHTEWPLNVCRSHAHIHTGALKSKLLLLHLSAHPPTSGWMCAPLRRYLLNI